MLADQELLTSILTYHVVAGESLDAAALGDAGIAATVNGADARVRRRRHDRQRRRRALLERHDRQRHRAHHRRGAHAAADDMGEMDEGAEESDMDEAAMMPTGPLCAAVPADGEGSFAGMTDDTAATAASNNPVLSTLVAAVQAAGLVDTLNSDGPFTIFAPANPAFDALPAGALDAVLADTDLLTSILTLHVVAGEQLSSADLAELDSVTTVNGADVTLEVADDGTLMVNGQASVGCADIQTANATVHVIDAVLMP